MNLNITIPAEYRGQFTIYQVDMNEINNYGGPAPNNYLLTKHRIPQLLYRIRIHAWNIVKMLFTQSFRNHSTSNYEFQLMIKVIDMNASHMQTPMVANLGTFKKWESNLFRWFEDHIEGCNLYVDMFYILIYEKSAV